MSETWRDVPNTGGAYQVSSLGNVKNIASGVGRRPGHMLKPTLNSAGYLRVDLRNAGTKLGRKFIHRLVAEVFLPNPRNLNEVNHIDGDKLNNSLSNLEWSTTSANQLHALAMGLKTPLMGQRDPMAKLTESEVRAIRASLSNNSDVAKIYRVSPRTIRDIRSRRTWKHI